MFGIESVSYGALLSPVLLAKLPHDLRLIVSKGVRLQSRQDELLMAAFEIEFSASIVSAQPILKSLSPLLTWNVCNCRHGQVR